MGNDSKFKFIVIGTIKVRVLNGVVRTSSNFFFSVKNDIINFNKSALIAMKGEKMKKLCTLIGKII